MKPGDYVAYFSNPNNTVIMTAEEAGLGPEHFAGVEEAFQEAVANKADSIYTEEVLFNMTNDLLKKEGKPVFSLEEYKRLYK